MARTARRRSAHRVSGITHHTESVGHSNNSSRLERGIQSESSGLVIADSSRNSDISISEEGSPNRNENSYIVDYPEGGINSEFSNREAIESNGEDLVQDVDMSEIESDSNVATVDDSIVQRAILLNGNSEFRIDWIRRLQSHFDIPANLRSRTGEFSELTIRKICAFQGQNRLAIDGIIGSRTRRRIEEVYSDMRSHLVGPHLNSGRLIVPAAATAAGRYRHYKRIIEEASGAFSEEPDQINLLAIRGVVLSGQTPNLEISQGKSAAEFASAREHDDKALADGSTEGDMLHSESASPPGHFDGQGFDDVIISVSYSGTERERNFHVREYPGSVDPNLFWSQSEGNRNAATEGTAHLRDGQYLYGIGVHHPSNAQHQSAVRETYGRRQGPVNVETQRGRLGYTALVPVRDIEIWRDGPAGSDDHYLTSQEEQNSNDQIYERNERYIDNAGIATNLHTSPSGTVSSLGCQNVPIGPNYENLIGDVSDSSNRNSFYYTLIDASKIGVVFNP